MLEIEKILSYTIPYCGNNRFLPYGKLLVNNGTERKICKIKDCKNYMKQYITFNRKKYYVKNIGTLYSPKYIVC